MSHPHRNVTPMTTIPDTSTTAPAHDGGDRPASDLAGRVDRLAAAVDALAAADLDRATAGELLDVLPALERHIRRADAQLTRIIGAAHHRDAATQDGMVSTAHWLRHRLGLDHADATLRVRTATRLADLDQLRTAAQAGAIPRRRLEQLIRAAVPGRLHAIRAVEDALTHLAVAGTSHDLARALTHLRDTVDPDHHDTTTDPDPASDATPGDPRREVHASTTFDGLVKLDATLDQLTGEKLLTLLDTLETPDPADTPLHQRRSPAQRRHDALADALDRLLATDQLPTTHGAKPHLLVLLDLHRLGADDWTIRRAWLPRTGDLPPHLLAELATQAKFTPILTWGPYRIAGVGRTQRHLPAWLRTLLHPLHATCRGPGCDRPITWTQTHHHQPWAHGGDTHLHNTIPLCQAHHTHITTGQLTVDYDPDTAICTWTLPNGRTTRTHPPPR